MPAHPPAAATAPESATSALYRAALGPVNTAHYLAVFERFDDAGRASPMWNPAAGLLTLNWMAFRQLWGSALVYLACVQGLAVLVLVLSRRFLHWPPSVEWGVLLALLLLSIAIPGAYGHALLHADARRRMTRAVRDARTVREACATLEKRASSKRRLWALVAINLLLAGVAVVASQGLRPGTPPITQVTGQPVQALPAAASAEAPKEPEEPEVPPVAVSRASADEPAPVPEPAPVIVSPPVLSALELEVAAPAAGAAPTPAAELEKVATHKAPLAAVSQAHGINVGLFADPVNAEKAHARLVEAGLPAILQQVDSPKGMRTRVRVGPFAGRAQADEAAVRIRAMGLDAVVFTP